MQPRKSSGRVLTRGARPVLDPLMHNMQDVSQVSQQGAGHNQQSQRSERFGRVKNATFAAHGGAAFVIVPTPAQFNALYRMPPRGRPLLVIQCRHYRRAACTETRVPASPSKARVQKSPATHCSVLCLAFSAVCKVSAIFLSSHSLVGRRFLEGEPSFWSSPSYES